ncbi:MAG: prepilin-type N-terminal cleavage/methylation domain-containing protein [Candidatus Nomurabacteria bacterium]|jgi:type II secretory pathway pseudopilin PulG|nr:prepilin-type N-terminal cleavage/methylation domain-containing protein [Candidatus Nomurabacteria bacterium]
MKKNQRGDTLIEVLIAITVLGAIVAGCMAVMNRSMVSIFNSAERTASRADINTQTDLLNYVYRNDKDTWNDIMNIAYTGDSNGNAPDNIKEACTLNPGSDPSVGTLGSFYLKPEFDDNGSVSKVTLGKGLTEEINGVNQMQRAIPGQGLWIDAVYYPQSNPNNQRSYVDFYIKACWVQLGNKSPDTNSRSMTVSRIYDYELDSNALFLPLGASIDFNQCGTRKLVTVAEDGYYRLQVWGAQGATNSGNKGGYTRGEIDLKKGDRLYVNVGCQAPSTSAEGGWNGGGSGSGDNTGGGGATDVRVNTNSLYARVIVAGGGGGPGTAVTPVKQEFGKGANSGGGGWYGGNGTNGSSWVYTIHTASSELPSDWLLADGYRMHPENLLVTWPGDDDYSSRSGNGFARITALRGATPAIVDPNVNYTILENGVKVRFDWSSAESVNCLAEESVQYRYRQNGGSWTYPNPADTTSLIWTIPAAGSYKLEVQARCGEYGTFSGVGSSTYTTPGAPSVPAVSNSVSNNGATITFNWGAASCPAGYTAQYRYQKDDGSWSSIVTSTSFAWTISASGSYKLGVQARCGVFGTWSGTGTNTYSTPTVAAPQVTNNGTASGGNVTFSWGTVSCPTGTTVQYQYRQTIGTGTPGTWVTTTGTSFAWNSISTPNSYKLEVQARCGTLGAWSPTGSSTFNRPSVSVSGTLKLTYSSSTTTTSTGTASGVSCASGATLQYRYKLSSDGSNARGVDWSAATTASSYANNTQYQGFVYTGHVQARCVTSYDTGSWSGEATVSFGERPLVAPGGHTGFGYYWTNGYGSTCSMYFTKPTCGPGGTLHIWYNMHLSGWSGPGNFYWYWVSTGAPGWWYNPWPGPSTTWGGTGYDVPFLYNPSGAVLTLGTRFQCRNLQTGKVTTITETQSTLWF